MGTGIELIERASGFRTRTAILSDGRAFTYDDLLQASAGVAETLLGTTDVGVAENVVDGDGEFGDLHEARIAFLIPASFEYAAVQWGIWRAGGMAVPLNVGASDHEIEYVLTNAEVMTLVVAQSARDRMDSLCNGLNIRLIVVEEMFGNSLEERAAKPQARSSNDHTPAPLPTVGPERAAMILYTSGTTSRPKGVVSTHANIRAQIVALVEAWGWEADDRIPLFLPLHHVHGIVNVLSCALWSGGQVETFPKFDQTRILERVEQKAYTLFMAVPTIYVKMIRAFERAVEEEKERWADGFRAMRLMVSGSAALPASIHEIWTGLTGQQLLERYGMTEIGMGLSNPLLGERRPGTVGTPLPGVELRLISEDGNLIEGEDLPGEIQVRGPAVFNEYWRSELTTRDSFVDGWFRTGDMAILENGYYRILGRLSVDIIKSGGEKLSALEIEDVLRQHPLIVEVAVVGVEDETWGEVVAAAVITKERADLELAELKEWALERLSPYKVPKRLIMVEDFPRNDLGKILKPAVQALIVLDPTGPSPFFP